MNFWIINKYLKLKTKFMVQWNFSLLNPHLRDFLGRKWTQILFFERVWLLYFNFNFLWWKSCLEAAFITKIFNSEGSLILKNLGSLQKFYQSRKGRKWDFVIFHKKFLGLCHSILNYFRFIQIHSRFFLELQINENESKINKTSIRLVFGSLF